MMTQGNLLARYKIIHELGRGATGAVYAARDRETGAVVALKRFDPALLSRPDAVARFLKNTRSAQLLKHRHIVQILDAAEVGGTVYVAMELLKGQNLRSILDAGPMRIARAIQIAHDIASALAYAHLEGVVHGAIKPSNIIVLPTGVVKITDFGTGQLAQAALLSGTQAGSLSTMAPEQLRGSPVDHRCDIFSLGALFYEMLTHRVPFEGRSPKDLMESMLRAKPRMPSELNPHVPRALDAIVLSMLAGEPVARMPGVSILSRELQGIEEGLGLEAGANAVADEPTASVPPAEPPEPTPGRPVATPFRDDASLHDAPRFREDPPIHADRWADEELEPRDRLNDREVFDHQRAMLMMDREPPWARASRSRPSLIAALALVLAVLSIGLTGFVYYSSGSRDLDLAVARLQEALGTTPAPLRPSALPPVAEATPQPAPPPSRTDVAREPPPAPAAEATGKPAAPPPLAEVAKEPVTTPPAPPALPEHPVGDGEAAQEPLDKVPASNGLPSQAPRSEPSASPKTESAVARATEPPASAGAAKAQEPPRAMPSTASTAKVSERQSGGTARVILDVSPRGEIYIDGAYLGTTPPLTTLVLEPGMRRIEVRSGSRKPYLTYMAVQPGDVRRIRHDFDAPRAINPPGRPPWQESSRSRR